MQYTYKIMLRNEPEGGYTVTVPMLPGCITYGEDIDEAIAMAKDAIDIYLEELQSRGEDIPDDSNTLEYSITGQSIYFVPSTLEVFTSVSAPSFNLRNLRS